MDLKNLFDTNVLTGIFKDVLKQVNSDIYYEFSILNQRLDKIEAAIDNLNKQTGDKTTVSSENNNDSLPDNEVKVIKLNRRGRRIKEPKICAKEGCNKPAKCKGLCTYHYQCSRKAIRTQEGAELNTNADNDNIAVTNNESDISEQELLQNIQPVIRKREDIENGANAANVSGEAAAQATQDDSASENLHPSQRPIV